MIGHVVTLAVAATVILPIAWVGGAVVAARVLLAVAEAVRR